MKKFILSALLALGAVLAYSGNRGCYFEKKVYVPQPLPTFAASRDQLPVPVYEARPDWINLYWKAWQTAFSHLRAPAPGSPFVSNWIDEGLCPQIFQWDTHFMAMFGRYAHHIFPFINSHDNFYASQHPDGMICRVINESDGTDHSWGLGPDNARAINPPLFCWAEIQNYKVTGDKSRFRQILSPLEHYAAWIEQHRRSNDTPHRLYWSNGQASGMDNTPRDDGRPSPGDGWDCHSAIDHVGWVDFSSQMVMSYEGLAYICRELGEAAKAKRYEAMAHAIAADVNKWMWNDRAGLYFDVTPAGHQTSCITAATFWPMLAGIASSRQCAALVRNLTDPRLFWTPVPVPSLALSQPQFDKMGRYWRGGVWAPVNYMVVGGLERYGYDSLATVLATRYLDALSRVYDKTHTLWEAYSPEIFAPATNASGLFLVEPDFVGWTGLGPISMLIETIIGIHLDASCNVVRWRLSATCRHGVRGLMFRGGRLDLMATPAAHGWSVTLCSQKLVTVQLCTGMHATTVRLEPGKQFVCTVLRQE
jgi:hypothetical protein